MLQSRMLKEKKPAEEPGAGSSKEACQSKEERGETGSGNCKNSQESAAAGNDIWTIRCNVLFRGKENKMIKKICICDRCGKEATTDVFTVVIGGRSLNPFGMPSANVTGTNMLESLRGPRELCPDCKKDLIEFLSKRNIEKKGDIDGQNR